MRVIIQQTDMQMEKSKLYTGTGDKGMTSLCGGQRVKKNSLRLEAYGTIDEFSSHLGVLAADEAVSGDLRANIERVQSVMFCIGAYLATESDAENPMAPNGLTEEDCKDVERWTDCLDAATPALHCFVLPGGTLCAARAHVARTVCRRAERRILDLADCEYVHPLVLTYVNRLSDWLFILARHANHVAGVGDVEWHAANK